MDALLQPLRTVAALGQKQQIALLLQHLAHPGGHLGIEGVGDVAQDQPHQIGLLAAQVGGGAVGHVVELFYRLLHPLGGGWGDAPLAVEHHGDGGDRHSRPLGDIGDLGGFGREGFG